MITEEKYLLTVNDFRDKCRVCLEDRDNMRDIFSSGVHDQMVQVTNLKIKHDDKLPKNLCDDCNVQLDQCYKFQARAKDSDNYLRILLLAEKSMCSIGDKQSALKRVEEKKRKPVKGHVRSKKMKCGLSGACSSKGSGDKIFLILVNEASKDSKPKNKVSIKYLDVERESLELVNFCRSFIKSRFEDHTYHSRGLSARSETEARCDANEKNAEDAVAADDGTVAIGAVSCDRDRRRESFESAESLREHCRMVRKVEKSRPPASEYACPFCSSSNRDKKTFMDHLRKHEEEGVVFSQTAAESESEEVAECDVAQRRIYKVNLDVYKCLSCKSLAGSLEVHRNHLKDCLGVAEEESFVRLEQHVKFTCPACSEIWVDDPEGYNRHLASHKKDLIFFVKTNESGESTTTPRADEYMFTPLESALEALSEARERANERGNVRGEDSAERRRRLRDAEDIFSCGDCEHRANSFPNLKNHYLRAHGEMLRSRVASCPVCGEAFALSRSDGALTLLTHLKGHKEEAEEFANGNGNGGNSDFFADATDIFAGEIRGADPEFAGDVCFPEIFLWRGPEEEGEGGAASVENCGEFGCGEKGGGRRCYVCEKCGRMCLGGANLRKHLVSHARSRESRTGRGGESKKSRPQCSVCNKMFLNRGTLNEHKLRHHGSREGSCDPEEGIDASSREQKMCEICGRRFGSNSSFASHRRQHASAARKSSLLQCKLCERRFKRESALERHLSAHLNPNYFECSECKLPLPSVSSLERHVAGHKKSSTTFDCKVCRLSFLTENRLNSHQRHAGHCDNPKRFECNVCHEKFATGRDFSRHIKCHPKYKTSECTLCGKRLSTVQSLMLHLGRHFEYNSILCPHCGKQFFEERNYHRHLLTHKGLKPFPCDVDGCKKSFYTYFELSRHKKYHNNTRNFTCVYCSKSFHEANHLKVHVRTHTGEKPYSCSHCGKGFVTRTRCKNHINLIHQGIGCDLIQSNISKKVSVFKPVERVAQV